MEIINRYIYAVTKELKEDRRKEVEKEVQMLINEIMEKYPEELDEVEKATLAIEKLGNPAKLADKYRGHGGYLIGPKYFNQYLYVLKLVAFAVIIGISVASIFTGINSNENVMVIIVKYISTIVQGVVQGAAWVTLIFAILQYKNVDIDKDANWSIKNLPEIPKKKNIISKGESVAAIIFTTIFFSILYLRPQIIGIYYSSESGLVNIPIFNIEFWDRCKIVIILIFLFEILNESLKLIWGVWNRKRAMLSSGITLVSSGLAITLFSTSDIWNIKAAEAISKYTSFEITMASKAIIMIIVIVATLEIATTLYKGIGEK